MRRLTLAAMAVMPLATACQRATDLGGEVAPDPTILSLDQVDIRPEFKGCVQPSYRTPGIGQISVRMLFVLGVDGWPERESISAIATNYRSDSDVNEARERLRLCQWTPALKEGEPVRVRMRHTIYLNRNH